MFTNAIVRTPSASLINGITTSAHLGKPNYEQALIQHQEYINALVDCGLKITKLPPLEEFPDSCFVEDVALLTEHFAVLTRPGALTRRNEVEEIRDAVQSFYSDAIYTINSPGTLEAGDVMRADNHFFIGLSQRTNPEGAAQLKNYLTQHGFTASTVQLSEYLHLKTGASYLDQNRLLVTGELTNRSEFKEFNQIRIDKKEEYAANCILINGTVLMPKGYPETFQALTELNYTIIEIDLSEFRKIDGGLSCLSLRF
ncbi:dimethylarginine dimethylaminohydrolase family protein [Legionella waltersii]|uniref:NG,NG-dimethylarginine dimethylaminohydrolase n=1 Tax=Legionella waltersii TaxID=66969 RepID=A0A0W1A1F8_9GAMM|nr:arginine deiminase family protein [Legionella waltersii]KTD75144.1 NG,NG-dimethylarginine dimethylaminohydrolase [Legionella waltersii]SNV04838.1 NG,NG-dimethylarginine dimethylaminohydrolase [Legionella waltersii]